MLGDLLLSQPSQVLPLLDTALKSAARAVYNAASAAEKIDLVNKHIQYPRRKKNIGKYKSDYRYVF